MNVIVVGGGKVGYYLAETLLEHGHKPFVIETDKEICRKIANNLDIPVINGDGTTLVVMDTGIGIRADNIARLIEREIDVATIKRLLSINRGEATISEVEIPKNYFRNGTSLMDFNLPNECVIVSITRGDSLIIPRGNTQIFSGDKLIVICRNEYLHQLLHALRIE